MEHGVSKNLLTEHFAKNTKHESNDEETLDNLNGGPSDKTAGL